MLFEATDIERLLFHTLKHTLPTQKTKGFKKNKVKMYYTTIHLHSAPQYKHY